MGLQLERDTSVKLSASDVRNLLKAHCCRRGRPRPALRIPVRGRRQILQEIERLVAAASAGEEVLYVDEVDIHLNPQIGLMYI